MLSTIERHKGRVVARAIAPKTRWKPGELDGVPTFADAPAAAPQP